VGHPRSRKADSSSSRPASAHNARLAGLLGMTALLRTGAARREEPTLKGEGWGTRGLFQFEADGDYGLRLDGLTTECSGAIAPLADRG
jgi:hypothetical protein